MDSRHRDSPGPQATACSSGQVRIVLDLGTTTLVGRLLTDTGTLLGEARVTNPQSSLGADILTRLQLAYEGAGAELQRLLADGMRALIGDLLAGASCQASMVCAVAAAGNPGISHLLKNLPVKPLIFPPHRAVLQTLTHIDPAEVDLGLLVPLQLFPAVSGFVGGDLLAVLLGCPHSLETLPARAANCRETFPPVFPPAESPCLVLDLGTNAELGVWTGASWWVSSAAAGPAFEAGNIACGMALAPGAVFDVHIQDDRLELAVAGGGRPKGLCGSGLMALLAAARDGGLIMADGRIVAPCEVETNLSRYLVSTAQGWDIRCHRDAYGEIRLTQQDVRQFQLAKGAVRAGIDVLLERSGVSPEAIAAVVVTGAFGTAISVSALRGVAMLPECMIDKLVPVSNGVLDGLTVYLADGHGPVRLQALLAKIKIFPLSGTTVFEQRFLQALDFDIGR